VTVLGNFANNLVITDTIPNDMTFVSLVNVSTGMVSNLTATTGQLLWTLPTPLAPGSYSLSYQTQVSTFTAGSPIIVNRAVMTFNGNGPVTTTAPVTVIEGYTIRINIYNSVGEVVKQLLVEPSSLAVDSVNLSANQITAINGPNGSIQLYFGSYLLGSWDGTNDANRIVSNGAYVIKIDSISSMGSVTTVSKNVTVNRSVATVSVNIYNSVGGVVRRLYSLQDDPNGVSMTNVTLSSNLLALGVSGGPATMVQILVDASNSPVTLTWDGTTDNGSYVTPGVYQVEVLWNDGKGSVTNISKNVVVMGGGAPAVVAVRPNVLNAAHGTLATFDATGVTNAYTVKYSIYAVSGELIASDQGAAGTKMAAWDAVGRASGVYIAVLEIKNAQGGVINHQRLKLLVMR
jgi:hypothetical protein